jgi:hypothetical protein
MALSAAPVPNSVTFQVGSNNGQSMPVTFKLRATAWAQVLLDTADIITALNAVTAGTIKGYTLSSRAVEDAYSIPTALQAGYGETATIVVSLEGDPTKTATIRLPMPEDGLFVAGAGSPNYDVIDIVDAAVTAYVGLFTEEGVAYISDGESADVILSGRRNN